MNVNTLISILTEIFSGFYINILMYNFQDISFSHLRPFIHFIHIAKHIVILMRNCK